MQVISCIFDESKYNTCYQIIRAANEQTYN